MQYGSITFPGIKAILSGQFSLTTGITPSVAVLTILPQSSPIPFVGALTITDGVHTIQFQDCLVDSNTFQFNDEGQVWQLAIKDRRWKWNRMSGGGAVSGLFGIKDDNGEYMVSKAGQPDSVTTKVSLEQLLRYCFLALDENNPDLSEVPYANPEVHWDYTTPADAISELCEEHGLTVVLRPDNTIKLCLVSTGSLPDGPIEQDSLTMEFQTIPDEIALVGGPSRFQAFFELEAVGKDTDVAGTIKPIDELSYKPAGGWEADTIEFDNVFKQFGEYAQSLAQECIFKMYRVKVPIRIPGYVGYPLVKGGAAPTNTISDRWKLKLETEQVEQYEESKGVWKNQPAIIYGMWMNPDDWRNKNNITTLDFSGKDLQGHRRRWTLDAATCIVTFTDPMYRNKLDDGLAANVNPNGLQLAPAKVYLKTACTLLDEYNFAPVRHVFSKGTGGSLKSGTRYEPAEDLIASYYPQYDNNGGILKVVDNLESLWDKAYDYLNGILASYAAKLPQTRYYVGILPIGMDGSIQNVTWRVDDSGFSTVVSMNAEQLEWVPPKEERRNITRLKHINYLRRRDRKRISRAMRKGKHT